MRIALAVALVCAGSGIAAADPAQVPEDAAAFQEGGWDAALPALSSDGTRLALPVTSEEYLIAEGSHETHLVAIVPVGAVTGTTIDLWDWDTESDPALLGERVRSLNAVLIEGGFTPLGPRQTGASITLTPEMTLSQRKGRHEIKLGSTVAASAPVGNELVGAWLVGQNPAYVYVEEYDDGAHQAAAADVSSGGGGTSWRAIAVLTPLEVLDAWMDRWKHGDAAGLRALLATPFEQTWSGNIGSAKKCRKKWLAKKAKQLAATIGCVLGEAGTFFFERPDAEPGTREVMTLKTVSASKKERKKLAKLVKKGYTLVQFYSDLAGEARLVVLAVKQGKVAMASGSREPYE